MVEVHYTPHLARLIGAATTRVPAGPLCDVLAHAFEANPRARGYVLDEGGAVRKHVVIFIGAEQIRDRRRLSEPVPDGASVHVLQALSGG